MTDPKFTPVDPQEMMVEGVLMAANEQFFWPLGLALTWDVDSSHGQYRGMLHVREWVYPDGHHERIALADGDEIGEERRERFIAWMEARIASMPDDESGPAKSLLSLLRR